MPHDPYADASAQLEAIATGLTSCEQLMHDTLARIDRVNPALNAIVSLRDPEALLAEARAHDASRAAGRPSGLLAGLPIAIKDLAATVGLRTTYGSPLYAEHVPAADDLMVARIRAAGAIVIGKTNTPEFGLGSQTYNPVFGTTGCAFDPALTAGGSSGGAAAALGAGLVTLADGSDMMGSLRNPAAYNHVFGLRPSVGRVPAWPAGDVFTPALGTAGPMARSARDLARLLVVQSGAHGNVPGSIDEPPAALWPSDTGDALAGLRIGWLGDWQGAFAMAPGVLDVCRQGLDRLARAGADVSPASPGFSADALWQAWCLLRQVAVAARLAPVAEHPDTFNALKPEARWEVTAGRAHSALAWQAAQGIRSDWHARLVELFADYDVLALPSAQCFAFDKHCHWPETIADQTMDTYHRWMSVVVPGSLSAGPTLAIPAGFAADGRAMGLQLMARPRAERKLLEIAAAYERAAPDLFAIRPDEAMLAGDCPRAT